MAKNKMVKVEMELPAVPGFEYTGEYRKAGKGEIYLQDAEVPNVIASLYDIAADYPIMRKAVQWREARPSDLENGPVVCRYSDDSQQIETNPEIGYFCGYDACKGAEYPFGICCDEDDSESDGYFRYCQVKDNA